MPYGGIGRRQMEGSIVMADAVDDATGLGGEERQGDEQEDGREARHRATGACPQRPTNLSRIGQKCTHALHNVAPVSVFVK